MHFIRDEEGATAIEYGLIAALVCVVLIVGLSVLGAAMTGMYDSISETVDSSISGASG